MTARHAAYVVVALLVGAAIAGVAVHYSGEARRARAATAAADSARVHAERERDSIRRAESHRADSLARATSERLESLAAAQREVAREAARLRSMIPAPDTTVRDSLRYWRATATSALAEVGALRAAVATQDSVSLVQVGRIARLTADAQMDAARMAALERENMTLARRLALNPPARECRIAGLLPCPSRTSSALAGAALTLLVMQTVDR